MYHNPIIEYTKNRIKRNKNLLALFTGQTGSGKSYSAMKFGESVDSSFNIDRVVFTIEDFMDLLNSRKIKKGMCIVFDEVGVGLPARDWYSIQNKLFNYIIQTFRHKNLIVLFTTPSLSYIDKQLRYLFHLYFESISINYLENKCIMKPMIVSYNPRFNKVYYKYPIMVNNGRVQTIDRIKYALPSKTLINEYEKKKTEYTHELNTNVQDTLNEIELRKEAKKKVFNPSEYVNKIKKNINKYLKNYRGRTFIDANLIRAEFNLSQNKAKEIKSLIEKEVKLN